MEFNVMVDAFEKFKHKKSKPIIVFMDFLTLISAMTGSSARGILHAELDYIDFDFLLLPAMDVSEILKEEMKFDR